MPDRTISAEDRWEILDLLGRFYWALDTGDEEAICALFTQDGVMTSGSGARFEGADGIRRFARHSVSDPTSRGRQHVARPLYFYAIGEGWTVRSYLTILHCNEGTGEKRIRTMSCSDDTCVKTGQGWRIKERRNRVWQGESLPWVGP
jgi:hypothetical protein